MAPGPPAVGPEIGGPNPVRLFFLLYIWTDREYKEKNARERRYPGEPGDRKRRTAMATHRKKRVYLSPLVRAWVREKVRKEKPWRGCSVAWLAEMKHEVPALRGRHISLHAFSATVYRESRALNGAGPPTRALALVPREEVATNAAVPVGSLSARSLAVKLISRVVGMAIAGKDSTLEALEELTRGEGE